jgi:hypothetical protein
MRIDGGAPCEAGTYIPLPTVPTKEHQLAMEREFGWRVTDGTENKFCDKK